MKSWLQTLGLTALLASQVLANDVELVSSPIGRRCPQNVVWITLIKLCSEIR